MISFFSPFPCEMRRYAIFQVSNVNTPIYMAYDALSYMTSPSCSTSTGICVKECLRCNTKELFDSPLMAYLRKMFEILLIF